MAVSTIWEARGIFWKFSGKISVVDLIRSNQEIYGDPRFDSMNYQILDLLAVEEVVLEDAESTVEYIREVAAMDIAASKSNPHIKVAIIVNHETLSTLASFYSELMANSPWQSQVFNSVEDARNWVKPLS